jgi:hypothetical protein
MFATNKRSSLLVKIVIYKEIKFYQIFPDFFENIFAAKSVSFQKNQINQICDFF